MKIDFNRVEIAMATAGVNQYDVADRMEISPSGISRILTRIKAERNINPKMAGRIASALGVDIERIIMSEPEAKS